MKRLLLPSFLLLGACAAPAAVSDSEPEVASDTAIDWQSAVESEADALRELHADAEVRIVVLDVSGANVLAQHGDVDVAIPTGSTIKPLTVFAALSVGLDPALEIDASAPLRLGDQTIQDARNNGVLTLSEAIAKSSNIAVARALQEVSWQEVYAEVATMVPLPASKGMTLPEAVGHLDGFVTRVPLQALVGGYAQMTGEPEGDAVLEMLRLAVTSDGTGERAAVAGVEVLGKTGTARLDGAQDAVFVGRAGDGETAVWIGVSVHDVPEDAYGGSLAAPAFAHIVERGLTRP